MDLIYPKTAVVAVDFNAERQICIASLRKKEPALLPNVCLKISKRIA